MQCVCVCTHHIFMPRTVPRLVVDMVPGDSLPPARYNIAMVLDFFYPQPGGVELHVYHLLQQLILRGHLVVIITHAYGERKGVRYLTNGLKVYYMPLLVVARQASMPTVFLTLPHLRNVFIREQIDIVHGHGLFLLLALEALLHAQTMGLTTVFTDHLLFGFADVLSILGNKLLVFALAEVDHVVCVLHTCKENTTLRARLNPLNVLVIPNAIIALDFTPADPPKPPLQPNDPITIVVISRLFQNKGIGLLAAAIPTLCRLNPRLRFLIAGDGPKFIDLEQMREQHRLQDRVELIGSIRHEEVRSVMVQGHIYLHPLLTEAFGTVLIEAVLCGLLVVTTKVGGIPEVLPLHMTVFAHETLPSALHDAVVKAVAIVSSGRIDPDRLHAEVALMYAWSDVATRTENVYHTVAAARAGHQRLGLEPCETMLRRIATYQRKGGAWSGYLFVLCCVVDALLLLVLEWWCPRAAIDLAPKWPAPARGRERVLRDLDD